MNYLIWSHEHGGWWKPGKWGYTRNPQEAGRYTYSEALTICAKAIPGTTQKLGALPALPVRESDLDIVIGLHYRATGQSLDLGPDGEAAPGFRGSTV